MGGAHRKEDLEELDVVGRRESLLCGLYRLIIRKVVYIVLIYLLFNSKHIDFNI